MRARNEIDGILKQDLYTSQGTYTTLPFTSCSWLRYPHFSFLAHQDDGHCTLTLHASMLRVLCWVFLAFRAQAFTMIDGTGRDD